MKKHYIVVLLIIIAIAAGVAYFAIGGNTKTVSNQSNGAVKDGAYAISIGSISSEGLPEIRAAEKFKEKVENESNGKIKVTIHPNGELGGDRQMLESISLGTLDMAFVTTSVLTTYDEKFGILDMPFAFSNEQEAFKAVDGELGKYLNGLLLEKAKMYNKGYMLNGVRHIINKKVPVSQPKDMLGLKMRIMESPIYESMFKALGANPTPMNFGEVYTSLQQNVIDGFECSANFIVEMKFYEVQKYFSLTSHTVSMLCIPMNKDKYDSLPDNLKKIVDDAVQSCLVNYQRDITTKENSGYIEQLKKHGMTIVEITPANHQKFVNAVQPVYDTYRKKWGTELFNLLKNTH